ncbi:MAG: hypothetical protein AAGI17_10035 [Planctomycetota bacterium]
MTADRVTHMKNTNPPPRLSGRQGTHRAAAVCCALLAAFGVMALTACQAPSRYTTVEPLVSPYGSPSDALWAVVPPRNESGLSIVDTAAVGDKIVDACQQVRGLRCLPINRTLGAMRDLGLQTVETPADARKLATRLGADAIIVGSVTAYDPYDPPSMGLTLALFLRDAPIQDAESRLFDPRLFQLQATDLAEDLENLPGRPAALGGGLYDARAHDTIAAVQQYAEGRTEPNSPFGWRGYLVSMGLYGEFVAHQAVKDLIEGEWLRLASGLDR